MSAHVSRQPVILPVKSSIRAPPGGVRTIRLLISSDWRECAFVDPPHASIQRYPPLEVMREKHTLLYTDSNQGWGIEFARAQPKLGIR
jgi:hypothetical protein